MCWNYFGRFLCVSVRVCACFEGCRWCIILPRWPHYNCLVVLWSLIAEQRSDDKLSEQSMCGRALVINTQIHWFRLHSRPIWRTSEEFTPGSHKPKLLDRLINLLYFVYDVSRNSFFFPSFILSWALHPEELSHLRCYLLCMVNVMDSVKSENCFNYVPQHTRKCNIKF